MFRRLSFRIIASRQLAVAVSYNPSSDWAILSVTAAACLEMGYMQSFTLAAYAPLTCSNDASADTCWHSMLVEAPTPTSYGPCYKPGLNQTSICCRHVPQAEERCRIPEKDARSDRAMWSRTQMDDLVPNPCMRAHPSEASEALSCRGR